MKYIILVEDDPGIQDIIKLVLNQSGYHLVVYESGEEIMNGGYHLPDLFILDKQLPGVDGLVICQHLKSQEHTKLIPIVMVSASPTIKMTAKAAGADEALEKPFKVGDLRAVVARYLSA